MGRVIGATIRGCTRHRIRTEAFPYGILHLEKSNLFNRTRVKRLFSSSPSPSPSKKEPTLSVTNRRDLLFLAVGICGAFGYYLFHRDSDWEKDVLAVQNKLIASSGRSENSACEIVNNKELPLPRESSFSNQPPPVVLRYVEKVLQQQPVSSLPSRNQQQDYGDAIDDTTNIFRQHPTPLIITAHQSGEYFASRQWYPFEAIMTAVASFANPGFVWDARTTILNLSNRVLEYYITYTNKNDDDNDSKPQTLFNSESGIVTKVWGKYPLIQVEEEDPYLLFWLAMTPLYPTVFLQLDHNEGRNQVLKWNDNDIVISTSSSSNARKSDKACAIAKLADYDTDTAFIVEFFFREEDDLLQKIKVTSPSLDQPWQAIYDNYEQHVVVVNLEDGIEGEDRHDLKSRQQILIPSSIEIGKGEGDQYHAHFKINNMHLSYKR